MKVKIIGTKNALGEDLYELYPWMKKKFPDGVITGETYAHSMGDGNTVVQFDGTGHSASFKESQLEREGPMEPQDMVKHELNEKLQEQERQEIKRSDIQDQITSLIPLAGTIELTKAQEEILYAPVKDEQVEIRPDGLIYLPWMEYVTRLRSVFGMSWSLIPYGPPKKADNFIHWAFWLIIKGKPYAFAVGEQQFFENDRMTYGDALEGAKSNALMRLCKGLGISLELWQPEFRRKWLPKYAESFPALYPDGKPKLDKYGKQKIEWRKKGTIQAEENNPEPESTHKEFKPIDPPREPKKPSNKIVITPLFNVTKKSVHGKDTGEFTIFGNLDGNEHSFITKSIDYAEQARKEKGTGLQFTIEYDEKYNIISMAVNP